MINYVDDFLYFANMDKIRDKLELTLKNKFHLPSRMGGARWYLGIHIQQHKHYIILD